MDYEHKEISTVATLLMINFAVMMNELSDGVVAHMYIIKIKLFANLAR